MADNKTDQNGAQAAAGNGQEAQPASFALQRIYLKDSSFESPRSPAVFQGKWEPKITFNLNTKNAKVGEGLYEVVLLVNVEAKVDDNSAFLVEVQQAGIFSATGLGDADLEHVLAAVCPNILFPYARETIDSLVVKGSFPPINLAPVNFDALFAQSKKRQAEEADKAAPEATN
ncbi:MAG: protein-export chaperone SecB [Pseudohongiellaceae bacterium]|nr:protein-export chaperone SecB [Pseudohongiellaceae bacterium]